LLAGSSTPIRVDFARPFEKARYVVMVVWSIENLEAGLRPWSVVQTRTVFDQSLLPLKLRKPPSMRHQVYECYCTSACRNTTQNWIVICNDTDRQPLASAAVMRA